MVVQYPGIDPQTCNQQLWRLCVKFSGGN